MAFMFGQPQGFWGAMQNAWPNYSQNAPRNMQGPMSWGQQHGYLSPYQPSGMYPFAPTFGYSSPFNPYGTGMSYLMPTFGNTTQSGFSSTGAAPPGQPQGPYGWQPRLEYGQYAQRRGRVPPGGGGVQAQVPPSMYPNMVAGQPQGQPSGVPSPPYGSYPGMTPGFGLKPPGAPYDVDPTTGEVVSNRGGGAPQQTASPSAMRYSQRYGRMLPVTDAGKVDYDSLKDMMGGTLDKATARENPNLWRAYHGIGHWNPGDLQYQDW